MEWWKPRNTSYAIVAVCFHVFCSGVALQHSQSAAPPDVHIYNENLGLSLERGRGLQTAEVPERVYSDHARHQHVTRAPEPPPAYDGAAPSRSRARNQPASAASENDNAAQLAGDSERRISDQRVADRNASVSARVYDVDQRMSASLNVSTSAQFTSDVSLASSNVTSYEDNGRQRVCLSTDPFYATVTTAFISLKVHYKV